MTSIARKTTPGIINTFPFWLQSNTLTQNVKFIPVVTNNSTLAVKSLSFLVTQDTFLYPCDHDTKRNIKSSVRWIRVSQSAQSSTDVSSVRIALMAGVFGYRSFTQRICRASFVKCGLWTMDYRIIYCFGSENDKTKKLEDQAASALVKNSDHLVRVAHDNTW